jgi:hypothetical protein
MTGTTSTPATVTTARAATRARRGHRPACLPPAQHGIRWTIRSGPDAFRVRAVTDTNRPGRLRFYDVTTGDTVLKVTHGQAPLPPTSTLLVLLRQCDPGKQVRRRAGLSKLTWRLQHTPGGYTVELKGNGGTGSHTTAAVPLPTLEQDVRVVANALLVHLQVLTGNRAATDPEAQAVEQYMLNVLASR